LQLSNPKGSTVEYANAVVPQQDAIHRCPALIVLKEENNNNNNISSGREANSTAASRQAGARPQALWVTSAQYGGFSSCFCVQQST